jgi:N utilization substance protein B
MQARRIARELALLGMSQLSDKPGKWPHQDFQELLQAAVKTLAAEAKDALEPPLTSSNGAVSRLVDSETMASDVQRVGMVEDSINPDPDAINRLAHAVELPEFIRLSNQSEVEAFSMELLSNTVKYQARSIRCSMTPWWPGSSSALPASIAIFCAWP